MPNQEKIQISVEINGDSARKQLGELDAKAKELRKSKRELKKGTEEYVKAAKELDLVEKEMDEIRKGFDLALLPQKELKKEIAKLNGEINLLTPGTEAFIEKSQRLNAVKGRLAEVKDEIKQAGEASDSLGGSFAALNPYQGQFEQLSASVGGMRGAIRGGVRSLGTLKTAFIATGIGAFVVVLGSLITFFTKTREGARRVERVMGALNGIIGKLTGDVGAFGKSIVEAVTNPKETIKELGDLIIENIENRFKSALVFGEAFSQLLDGEFSKAAKTAGDAAIQFATGVTDGTDKIAEGTKAALDYGESLLEAGEKGFQAADQNIRLRDSIRQLNVAQAEFQAESEKNRKIRDDERLSLEERLAANDKVLEFEKKRTDAQKALVNARLQILKNERKTNGELTEEQLDEQSELLKELADIQDDFESRTTEQQTEKVSLIREAAEQQKQVAVDLAQATLNASEEGSKAQLKAKKATLEAEKQLALQQAENEITNQEALNAKKMLIESEFQAALKALKNEEDQIELQRQLDALSLQEDARKLKVQEQFNNGEIELIQKVERENEIEQAAFQQKLALVESTLGKESEAYKKLTEERLKREEGATEAVKILKESELEAQLRTLDETAKALSFAQSLVAENTIVGKGLAIAQATIAAYSAGAKTLAEVPFPANIPAMITIIGTGLKQVAKIAGVKVDGGKKNKKAKGGDGILKGPSHAEGGLPVYNPKTGQFIAELEGNEIFLSKATYANNKPVVDALLYNSMHRGGAPLLESGGTLPAQTTSPITSAASNAPNELSETSAATQNQMSTQLLMQLNQKLDRLIVLGGMPNKAFIVNSEFEANQQRLNEDIQDSSL